MEMRFFKRVRERARADYMYIEGKNIGISFQTAAMLF
jgi:hypothetical protein